MKFKCFNLAFIVFTAMVTLVGSNANASLIVSGAGSKGLSCLFSCTKYYQQAYDASLFEDNQKITSISFWAGDSQNEWADNNSWELTLSSGSFGVNSLTNDFDSNIGISSAIFDIRSFSGIAKQGDYITFTGDFFFDATKGNDLLISIKALGDLGGAGLGNNSFAPGQEFSAAYSGVNDVNASSDALNLRPYYGLITTFELEQTSSHKVPEPSTLAIFSLAFVGLLSRKYMKNPQLS